MRGMNARLRAVETTEAWSDPRQGRPLVADASLGLRRSSLDRARAPARERAAFALAARVLGALDAAVRAVTRPLSPETEARTEGRRAPRLRAD